MDEADRRALLKRVSRQGATVGAKLPETVIVEGTEIDLDAFLIETRALERIPPEAAETLAEAKRVFRDAREERYERLKEAPLDEEEAESLATEIIGIDRALNALDTIRRPRYGDESQANHIEDYKRWLGFLESVQG